MKKGVDKTRKKSKSQRRTSEWLVARVETLGIVIFLRIDQSYVHTFHTMTMSSSFFSTMDESLSGTRKRLLISAAMDEDDDAAAAWIASSSSFSLSAVGS